MLLAMKQGAVKFQWLLLLLHTGSLTILAFVAPLAFEERTAKQRCRGANTHFHDDVEDLMEACSTATSTYKNSPFLRRREALQTGAAALVYASGSLALPSRSCATAQLVVNNGVLDAESGALSGIDCLQDLPPFDSKTTVRLFLARHGETENNRLNKLQGARIDAPINATGERQATLLGQALARADVPPQFILHSPLQRAQQTARIAAAQLTANNSLVTSSTASTSTTTTLALDVLTELDFGPAAEGEPVEARRAQRLWTYAQWASGNLNVRMNPGGETGREVSQRMYRILHFFYWHLNIAYCTVDWSDAATDRTSIADSGCDCVTNGNRMHCRRGTLGLFAHTPRHRFRYITVVGVPVEAGQLLCQCLGFCS